MNADGTPRMYLAGYVIRCNSDRALRSQKVTISNPGVTKSIVANRPAGTRHVTPASGNSTGIESNPNCPAIMITG